MSTHPSFTRCQAIAEAAGSNAKTVKGVARFLAGNKVARRSLWTLPRPMSAASWKLAEKTRKADPEAQRAIHDKAFRRRFLSGLNRREAKAIKCDGTIDGVMWYYAQTGNRAIELRECARLRSIVTGKECKAIAAPSFGHRVSVYEAIVRRHGVKLVLRGKNYSISSTKRPSYFDHKDGETEWKNGRAVKYNRATNDNFVRSLAVIRDSQTLDYVLHETTYTVSLPDGFQWGSDQNGLRVFCVNSPSDDMHPTAGDLVEASGNPLFFDIVISANRRTRMLYAAERTAESAKLAGVFVCLADSLRAGNCKAGTLSFASRHNLDPAKHYEAPELLAQANGDEGRVRLAITAARLRHEREEKNGFCILDDHKV